jgi:hypothetical protein
VARVTLNRIRASLGVYLDGLAFGCALLTPFITLASLGCAVGGTPPRGAPHEHAASDPCAPGGKSRRPNPNVVLTTRTKDGQVIDWIPATSQTPNGQLATPPPPAIVPLGRSSSIGIAPEDRGPKGTVPVIRSRQPMCDCYPGFVQQVDGKCASVEASCVGEGGMASAKTYTVCCSGLRPSENVERVADQCVVAPPGAHYCTRCGNESCGPGENSCNCPQDCKQP